MSAPAGWYPQPDGTERFWDGGAWTEQVRSAPVPPTMPVPPPPPVGGEAYQTPPGAAAESTPYGAPGPTHGQPGPGGGPYAAPGSPYGPPSGRSGMNRGCLIAALITAVVLILGVGGCIVAAMRVADDIKEAIPSLTAGPLVPEDLPSELASRLASADPNEQHEVVVRITGTGSGKVTWTVGQETSEEEQTFPFEAKKTVNGLVAATILTVPPITSDGPLTCEIEVDGEVVTSQKIDSATDQGGILACFHVGL